MTLGRTTATPAVAAGPLIEASLLATGSRTALEADEGPAEARPVCNSNGYGLTGRSCKRLFDRSVAMMARMMPGTSFSKTLDKPGGKSEERCGSPAACAAAEDAMAKPTAAPSKLVIIVGLRMALLQPGSPVRGRMRKIAVDVRSMRHEVVRSGLVERADRGTKASRFSRETKRSEGNHTRSEIAKLGR